MSTGNDSAAIGKLEKKVDKLAEELKSVGETLKVLTTLPGLAKQVDTISSEIKDVKTGVSSISKVDDILSLRP